MKRLACPAAVLALSMMFGCNSGTNDQTVQNETSTPSGTAAPAQPVVINGVGTEPAQAVAVFLDSLRRGDESAANGVLTNLAREQVQKTNFQIQPPGNPEGKYEIGRVGFPYPEKTVALVECQWTEPTVAGQPPEVIEIVCEVHQEAEGWRIAGLGFKIAGSEDTLVLDFENASSLQATLEGATSPSAPASQTAAQGQVQPGQFQPGQLPPNQFPTNQTNAGQFPPSQLPSGQEFQQNQLPQLPPSQIALPPLNNAPVNR